MRITRRALFLGAGFAPLVGCAGTPLTPAEIVADAQAASAGLSAMLSGVAAALPGLIPAATLTALKGGLSTAQSVAASLNATLPAAHAASGVQQVLAVVNAVLNALAGPPVNGAIPAPFNIAVAAAAVVAPELEAFVAQYLPQAAASPATLAARASFAGLTPVMTPGQARALLLGFAAR